jgi:hypothetical protein
MNLSFIQRLAAIFTLGLFSLIIGQQCARIELTPYEEVSFLSLSANPYRLDPPIELPQIRRMVIFVDMSYSMVSGPCPQDVDRNIFNWNAPNSVYDPNKNIGDPNDHRNSGVDCIVDTQLPQRYSAIDITPPNIQNQPARYYRTFLGSDFDKKRFQVVRKWLQRAREDSPQHLIENTSVMLLPITGGKSLGHFVQVTQGVLGSNIYRFLNVTDPKLDQLLTALEQAHDAELQNAVNDDVWRYEHRKMGTTVISSHLNRLYDHLQGDMRSLNSQNLLQFTDYQIIYLTDGNLTPIHSHISKVLNSHSLCRNCASDPRQCVNIGNTCGSLATRMIDAWGDPKDNDLDQTAMRLGMITALPFYFGTGFVRYDFAQLSAEKYTAMNPPEARPFFEDLRSRVKAQNFKMRVWPQNTSEPAFNWVGDIKSASSFEVTDIFLMNLNYRMGPDGRMILDSDGDGLSDELESQLGSNPTKARTNGFFLDGMAYNPAFKQQIEAISRSNSCDPELDSDGDSLNECEETLLGTNSFDFDTDGDGIPDSWEWLYGLNPLINDMQLDSNGDGVTNKVAFSWALPPSVTATQVHASTKSRYQVNFKGKDTISHERFGTMMFELYEVIVEGIPVSPARSTEPKTALYNTRLRSDPLVRQKAAIPEEEQILTRTPSEHHNQVIALARIIDRSNPDRIYWRMFKTNIPISNVYKQPQLDLSLFKQIRARDYND